MNKTKTILASIAIAVATMVSVVPAAEAKPVKASSHSVVIHYTLTYNDLRYINRATKHPYTVKKGDTLWSITARFYGSGRHWQYVAWASRLKVTRIHPGQTLYIPIYGTTPPR